MLERNLDSLALQSNKSPKGLLCYTLSMSRLFFYGKECPHCEHMEKLVRDLEKEKHIQVERLEVWHNDENMKKFTQCDKDDECGGVPFFVNTDTGATICGETSYEELRTWANI